MSVVVEGTSDGVRVPNLLASFPPGDGAFVRVNTSPKWASGWIVVDRTGDEVVDAQGCVSVALVLAFGPDAVWTGRVSRDQVKSSRLSGLPSGWDQMAEICTALLATRRESVTSWEARKAADDARVELDAAHRLWLNRLTVSAHEWADGHDFCGMFDGFMLAHGLAPRARYSDRMPTLNQTESGSTRAELADLEESASGVEAAVPALVTGQYVYGMTDSGRTWGWVVVDDAEGAVGRDGSVAVTLIPRAPESVLWHGQWTHGQYQIGRCDEAPPIWWDQMVSMAGELMSTRRDAALAKQAHRDAEDAKAVLQMSHAIWIDSFAAAAREVAATWEVSLHVDQLMQENGWPTAVRDVEACADVTVSAAPTAAESEAGAARRLVGVGDGNRGIESWELPR